ncbi:MAG: VOC family protein [bacterium]|nr:VOC family protein [bacterium]
MKFLHVRFRVSDQERSVAFYRDILGMREVRRLTSPAGNSLVFMEMPGSETLLELAWSPDFGEVQLQEDLIHLAFGVEDMEGLLRHCVEAGLELWPADALERGSDMVFISDPDGYEIELLKR